MFKYIVRDMVSVLHFIPYGIAAGIVVLVFLNFINSRRVKCGKEPVTVPAAVSFYMYLAVLLVITLFSRESGSGNGFDMVLFSTWGINARNNAYLVENILLFIPYGIVCPWYFKNCRGLIKTAALGLVTSAGIECLQLMTRRGVFQIDDILTNLLGSMIGYLIFGCMTRILRKQ